MYQLNEQTEDLLDRVRMKLETELGEMSPESGGTTAGDGAAAGVGGAKSNPTDVADAFDMYLDTLLERLVNETSKSENAAASYIVKMAGQLASEGDLPPFPSEGSDDEVSVWLGKAKTVGFQHYVMRQANA